MGGRGVGEEDDGGGSLKEDPSNWRSRIFPEHRETLPRLPGPGETCSPVLQGRRTSSLRNSGNGVRLGVEGRGRRILFLLRSRPPVVSTTARGTDVSGRREEEREERRRRRFGFVGARRQIHVQLLLPAEFMGCLRWLRKLAASINSFPAALRFLGLGEIYFLRRFFSFLPLFIRINDWFNFLGSRGLHP